MPPAWLLDAIDAESQETSTSATNTTSPTGTSTGSSGRSNQADHEALTTKSPTNRHPEVRDAFSDRTTNRLEQRAGRAQTSPVTQTPLNTNNPFSFPTQSPPPTNNYGVSSELSLADVYPGLSELDRTFIEGGSTDRDRTAAAGRQRRTIDAGGTGAGTSRSGYTGAGYGYGYAQGLSETKDLDRPSPAEENQNRLRSLLQRQNERRNQQEMESRLGVLEQLASLTLQGIAESSVMANDRYRAPDPYSLFNDDQNITSLLPLAPMGGPSKPPPLTVLSCEVCGTPTFQLCSGCQIIGYCNSEHQEKDWPRHADECSAWAEYYAGLGAEAEDEQDLSYPFDSPNHSYEESNPFPLLPSVSTQDTPHTTGAIFEVDAILLPANKDRPELVKALFRTVLLPPDSKVSTIAHGELCFEDLLGKVAPWVPDGQWDEDMDQLPSLQRYQLLQSHLEAETMPRFSLHCRPNGRPNTCYIAVAGADVTRQSAVAKFNVSVWGDIDPAPSSQELHGNGNFLILRHPPKTCCPEVAGMLVEDATLDDLDELVPYLQQRRHFMGLMGGVSCKQKVCPSRIYH